MEIVGWDKLDTLLNKRLLETKSALTTNNQKRLFSLLRMGNLYFTDDVKIDTYLFQEHSYVSWVIDEIHNALSLSHGGPWWN